jgi:hypothetical protein
LVGELCSIAFFQIEWPAIGPFTGNWLTILFRLRLHLKRKGGRGPLVRSGEKNGNC